MLGDTFKKGVSFFDKLVFIGVVLCGGRDGFVVTKLFS